MSIADLWAMVNNNTEMQISGRWETSARVPANTHVTPVKLREIHTGQKKPRAAQRPCVLLLESKRALTGGSPEPLHGGEVQGSDPTCMWLRP